MEKSHWEMRTQGVESKPLSHPDLFTCFEPSNMVLPITLYLGRTVARHHQHPWIYILSKLISFLFCSNLELAGNHRSSCEVSVRVNPWARPVLSPARQPQENWFCFLSVGEFCHTCTPLFVWILPGAYTAMSPPNVHPVGKRNFNKVTPQDQPHLDKSMFPLILWPMPPVKTYHPGGEKSFCVCLAYRSTPPFLGFLQQARPILRSCPFLGPTSVFALSSHNSPLPKYKK